MASGGSFNCADWDGWYYKSLSRTETQEKLNGQPHGTFLVRDSTTIPGDYVLSVSENSKVSHYIINKAQSLLKIGDQSFSSMPQLLDFYKVHYLDTTTLITPHYKTVGNPSQIQVNRTSMGYDRVDSAPQSAPETSETDKVYVQGLYEFQSEDPDDLQFRKGEILEIIEKPEENWWTARNKDGKIGQIPVPYVGSLGHGRPNSQLNYQLPPMVSQQLAPRPVSMPNSNPTTNSPVFAKVVLKRVGNAYDPTALSLEVGDVISVHKMHKSGQWEGECKGKVGTFPFTHVEIMENPNKEPSG